MKNEQQQKMVFKVLYRSEDDDFIRPMIDGLRVINPNGTWNGEGANWSGITYLNYETEDEYCIVKFLINEENHCKCMAALNRLQELKLLTILGSK